MNSLSLTLELALQHHQAGDLHQAETLYRQILQIDPQNAEALHLLGVIAHQVGRNDLAIDYIQQALRFRPEFPAACSNLGMVLMAQGKPAEAQASYQQVIRLRPDDAGAYFNVGNALKDQGKLEEAIGHYEQALRLRPGYAEAHNNLGTALLARGKLAEALESCRQAVRLKPDNAQAYYNIGMALAGQGSFAEAIAGYQQALRLKPDFAEAHHQLGNALKIEGRIEEAITSCRQALRLQPDNATAYINLGSALRFQGKPDEAISNYQQALRLNPDSAQAYNYLGNALKDQGKLEEAIGSYRHALRLGPNDAQVYNNLGNALRDQGKFEEAATICRQAVRLEPNLVEAHCNLGQLLLLMGEFSEGWREFEWRWQTRPLKPHLKQFSQPLWQGDPLHEGAILLHAEQGLGDTFQFIRFAALVKQRVGAVLCECPPNLVRLLQSCVGIDRIIPFGEPLPAFDVHAPLMSLPGILKTTLETIPARVPYLYADAALTEAQARLLGRSQDFKVGIVWQARRQVDADLKRFSESKSLSLALFEPLARLPGVQLISLQKGDGVEQIEQLAGRFPVTTLGSTCDDFDGTAAVMKNLDLVISADTAPAHLAGALGVPVWVPLPSACCWRWLTQREDSPWYPTMRLFRQNLPGDWSKVFERMARELRELVS